MQDHDGLITREIKRTIWDWVVDHGHTEDCPFFCERYDDASYPLRYACAAFGLFPDAAPVRQVLQTLKLGWYGSHGTRRTLITGHDLLALLPHSPTPAARRILAWYQAGYLVGDIPSGVQRLQEHARSLLAAIERHGALPIDEECATLTGFVFYRPAALPMVLEALHLDEAQAEVAPVVQRVAAEGSFDATVIWALALHSPLPEARAFRRWYHDEFLPALRSHGWYDPERGHAIPPRQAGRCAYLQNEWQVQFSGDGPVEVAILERYEATASYSDAVEEEPF
jgi:hypothetical protein